MQVFRIAVPIADAEDERRLRRRLQALHVPMDPCAGDPRFDRDAAGRRRLLVVVTAAMADALRADGRTFETLRDFADTPDPIRYVSKTNRYADALARLRAGKGRR